MSRETTASLTSEFVKENYSQVLKVTHLSCEQEGLQSEKIINIYNESVDVLYEWKEAIEKCVDRLNEKELKISYSKGRLFEGMVFKMTRATPHKWVERHFELHGSKLLYKHSPTEEVRWELDLIGAKVEPNRCSKESHPTPFTIQVRKEDDVLNLCFPTETAYLKWMQAIAQNLELNVDRRS